MESKKQTAVIYTRCASTDGNPDEQLRQQEQLCHRYCEKNGIQVIGIFKEPGKSGISLFRPELLRAALCICDNDVTMFVCADQSRLSRDIATFTLLEQELAGLNVQMVYAASGLVKLPADVATFNK